MSSDKVHVFKYAREEEHYSDAYDRGTIRECKFYQEGLAPKLGVLEAVIKNDDGTEMTMEQKQNEYARCQHIIMHTIKGERYLAKAETIKKWMDRDRELDCRLERTPVKTRYCDKCGQTMECTDKSYYGADYNRIMLMYDCPDCKKVRAFYDDGEEYVPDNRCKKCRGINSSKSEKDDKRILITDTCMVCGNIENHEFSLAKDEPEDEKQKEAERRQFLADREKYCFSEKEGGGYLHFKEGMKDIEAMVNKDKEKEKNKALYDEVAKVQKLNIAQLKKLLGDGLEKENYLRLEFSSPEMGREVTVNFTVQENDISRKEYDSQHGLKKLIEGLLYRTNWRLMSDGICTRLGVLSGRLKGVESEEEIIGLVKRRKII